MDATFRLPLTWHCVQQPSSIKAYGSYSFLTLRCRVCITVGCPSVCLSVCPVDRQQQRREAGLLPSSGAGSRYRSQLQAPRTGCVSISAGARAAVAGIVALRAEVRGSTQTYNSSSTSVPNETDLPSHLMTATNKPFIGFWQPRKAGLNKHTGKSCIHKIHKITSLEMI